jgi:hypothetical protein
MGKTKRQQHRSRPTNGRRDDGTAGDGTRVARLQELIREEVNLILRNEVRDPRLDRRGDHDGRARGRRLVRAPLVHRRGR